MRPYLVVLAPREEQVWTVMAHSAMDAIRRTDVPEGWDIVRVEIAESDGTVSEVVA